MGENKETPANTCFLLLKTKKGIAWEERKLLGSNCLLHQSTTGKTVAPLPTVSAKAGGTDSRRVRLRHRVSAAPAAGVRESQVGSWTPIPTGGFHHPWHEWRLHGARTSTSVLWQQGAPTLECQQEPIGELGFHLHSVVMKPHPPPQHTHTHTLPVLPEQ